ncbi:iron complex outermembrane receptor protein [Luteibacter sp. W1I16]|uniref:TonB-dependent receptor n=1 Tax=Luteibacter sp. W1I16 TaxID=3373922 RepID=UPI003D232C48
MPHLLKQTVLAIALGMAFASVAQATDTDTTADTANAAARRDKAQDLDAVSVIGTGETRQVQRLRTSDQKVLPPGTSLQKVLNVLPGVNAQSADALGTNEQSMTLSLRGFSGTRLGYTLDGMPLGDSAYNNYNGLSINRALISENFAGAELSEGIGNLGTPSTSNLGGTIAYSSSDPLKTMGGRVVQGFGSDQNRHAFARFDTGEYNGFSMYLSGARTTSDLWNNQSVYNGSTTKQFNGKAVWDFDWGRLTGFADTSRTSQADYFYLSKSELARRLGWDWGGYAPDWQRAIGKAYCNAGTLNAKLCDKSGADTDADGAFTAGQILRDDDLYYLAGDFFPSDTVTLHAQVYHHEDAGEGHNWNSGTYSYPGTPRQLPIIFRNTLYTINRSGAILSAAWDFANHHIEGGVWYEHNVSSASRYSSYVSGPRDLSAPIDSTPDLGVFAQRTVWNTRQAFLQDTIRFLDDALTVDVGVKSPHVTSQATALPGDAVQPIKPTSNNQFASGKLSASKALLPQFGARYKIADGQEVFASFAKNIAMFQGGFKLGPQAVSQAIWDTQGDLKPEKSRSIEAGYRIETGPIAASLAAYNVRFDNRLLQYNPCDSRQPVGPSCGNRFYNVGGVDSHGVEVTFVWTPTDHLRWYNSASYNRSTYASDYTQAGVVQHTKGKIQTDTPTKLFATQIDWTQGAWFASLRGKYTGERFYTYTNDQGFGGFTVWDLSGGYDFGPVSFAKDIRLSLNVTNLGDKRYASNFDSSAFVPSDPKGTAYVFHASAPRQYFANLDVRF